jgi:hypothetical protein
MLRASNLPGDMGTSCPVTIPDCTILAVLRLLWRRHRAHQRPRPLQQPDERRVESKKDYFTNKRKKK